MNCTDDQQSDLRLRVRAHSGGMGSERLSRFQFDGSPKQRFRSTANSTWANARRKIPDHAHAIASTRGGRITTSSLLDLVRR
jgi:hypothetical protein